MSLQKNLWVNSIAKLPQQVGFTTGSDNLAMQRFYQLCHVDVSTRYGKKVAEVFKVTSFPHTVITDKQGKKVIFEKSGQFSDAGWITTLSDYRHGNRPFSAVSFSGRSGSAATLPRAATCFT